MLDDPSLPLFRTSRELLDKAHFRRYCYEREKAFIWDYRWSPVQLGMLQPSLKILWAVNWAEHMRFTLDSLPYGRNISIGLGEEAPIWERGLSRKSYHLYTSRIPRIASVTFSWTIWQNHAVMSATRLQTLLRWLPHLHEIMLRLAIVQPNLPWIS